MNANRTDSAETADDYLRTDPAQRRKVQRLIAAMAVAALLLWWLGLPALKHWVDVGDIATMIRRMALLCYATSAMLLATAVYAAWYANRILRSSQFPPPGSWVMRDTRILRGDHARARGWWVVACAVSFLLLAGFAAFKMPAQFEGLMRTTALPHAAPMQPPPVAPAAPPVARPRG